MGVDHLSNESGAKLLEKNKKYRETIYTIKETFFTWKPKDLSFLLPMGCSLWGKFWQQVERNYHTCPETPSVKIRKCIHHTAIVGANTLFPQPQKKKKRKKEKNSKFTLMLLAKRRETRNLQIRPDIRLRVFVYASQIHNQQEKKFTLLRKHILCLLI